MIVSSTKHKIDRKHFHLRGLRENKIIKGKNSQSDFESTRLSNKLQISSFKLLLD